jgi:hypothetical protein
MQSRGVRRVGDECDRPRKRAFLRVAAAVGRVDVLLLHAWRSSVAVAGETTAPSRMEQSVDVGGALLLLVRSASQRRGVVGAVAHDRKAEASRGEPRV